MSARPTPALYERLVKAYEQLGRAEYAAAGRIAGCSALVAKRGWDEGWPQRDQDDYPMPAIKTVFEAIVVAARSARARATRELMKHHSKSLKEAVDDAAQQRAIEGMAVRSIMVAVDSLARETVAVTHQILPRLTQKVVELAEKAMADPDVQLGKLQQITTWLHQNLDLLSKTADKAQVMERRYMGEAESTLKIIDGRSQDEKVAALTSALVLLAQRGKLGITVSETKVLENLPQNKVIDAEVFDVSDRLKIEKKLFGEASDEEPDAS